MATTSELIAEQLRAHYDPVNKLRAKHALSAVPMPTAADLNAFRGLDLSGLKVKGSSSGKKKTSEDDIIETTLSPLEQLKADMVVQKEKIAGVPDLTKHDSWFDTLKKDALNIGGHLIDYAGRPGAAARAAYEDVGSRVLGRGDEKGRQGFLDKAFWEKVGGAFAGQDDKQVSGAKLVEDFVPGVKGMSGGWQKTALTQGGGIAAEIVSDPTTYVGGGATNVAGQSVKQVIEQGGKSVGKTVAAKLATDATARAAKQATRQAARQTKRAAKVATGEKALPGVQRAYDAAAKNLKLNQTVAKGGRKVGAQEIETEVSRQVYEQLAKAGSKSTLRRQAEKEVADIAKKTAKETSGTLSTAAREEMIQERVYKLAETFSDQLRRTLQANTERKYALKILGRDVLTGRVGQAVGKGVYKPFGAAFRGGSKVPGVAAAKAAFSMGEHFSGLTDRVRRLAESKGVVSHEVASKHIDNIVRDLSRDERKEMLKSLERGERSVGVSASGKDLGEVWDAFDQLRRDKFEELVDSGILQPGDNAGSYFTPQYYRKGSPEDIKAFKQGRKQAMRLNAPGHLNHLNYGVDAAKSQGLKPYELVDDAFKMYDADVARKMVRQDYRRGLFGQYGVTSGAHDLMKKQGMRDYTKMLSKAEQDKLEHLGEKMYLHPEFAKSLDSMEKFAKMGNNEDLNKFFRHVNSVTNGFKQSATVYNPGNWVNNTMGDIFLNYVDGLTNPIWYKRAAELMRTAGSGTIKVGDYQVSRQQLRKLYDEFAGGAGFLHANTESTIGSRLGNLTEKVGKAYQGREDFSRMAHFLYSLDEEFKRLPQQAKLNMTKKGGAFEKKLRDAAERSGERVSKWNIDYSAFTPAERRIKKYVPFYSWQRKSIPLMLEALATKPGRVTSVQHIKSGIEGMMTGGQQRGDYATSYPLWMRDAGFMRLSGGETPTVIKDPLPTNVFGGMFGGEDWGDVLRNQAASLHPGLRIPMEVASGKQLFTGRDMPADTNKYLMSQFPGLGPMSALLGENLRSTATDAEARQMSPAERIGALLGSKPYKVDEPMQVSELRRQQDQLDFQLKYINDQLGDWEVRKNRDGTYQVYNKVTKEKSSKYRDPGMAMSRAADLAEARHKA